MADAASSVRTADTVSSSRNAAAASNASMSSDRNELLFELRDETVRRAVEPEAQTSVDGRSESVLVDDGIVVRTDDLRELRAAVNGWRRLVSVAEQTDRLLR